MGSRDDREDSRVTPFRPAQIVPEAEHDHGLLGLTDGELTTLRRLAQRLRDDRPGAVNIRHAQRLADLGLAKHDRGGWTTTPDGVAYLSVRRQPPETD